MCVCVLRMVSVDTILCCTNTLIIIISHIQQHTDTVKNQSCEKKAVFFSFFFWTSLSLSLCLSLSLSLSLSLCLCLSLCVSLCLSVSVSVSLCVSVFVSLCVSVCLSLSLSLSVCLSLSVSLSLCLCLSLSLCLCLSLFRKQLSQIVAIFLPLSVLACLGRFSTYILSCLFKLRVSNPLQTESE